MGKTECQVTMSQKPPSFFLLDYHQYSLESLKTQKTLQPTMV